MLAIFSAVRSIISSFYISAPLITKWRSWLGVGGGERKEPQRGAPDPGLPRDGGGGSRGVVVEAADGG